MSATQARIESCRKAGQSKSEAKTAASRRNAKLDTRTTEQRSRDGKRSRLTEDQYRLNAFRAWANRKDRKPGLGVTLYPLAPNAVIKGP